MKRDCSDDNDSADATTSASDDEMKAAIHLASLVERNQKTDGGAAKGADDDGSECSWSVGETSNNVPDGGNESQKPPVSSEMQEDGTAACKDLNRFPNKLMQILDSKEYEEIFSWNKEGNAIVIHKPYDLISHVLTRHFGAKEDMRFDSFLRKLYRWGFSKHLEEGCSDEGEHIYCHNHFRRGDYASCSKVKCSSKPSSWRIPVREIHPQELPNLYAGILQPSVNPMGSMGSTCSHYLNHVPQTNLGNTNLLLQQLSVAVAQQRQRSQQNPINAATLQHLAQSSSTGTTSTSTMPLSQSIHTSQNGAVTRVIESALVNREIKWIKHENNLLSQLATNLQQVNQSMNQQLQALSVVGNNRNSSSSGNASSAYHDPVSASSQAISSDLSRQAALEHAVYNANATMGNSVADNATVTGLKGTASNDTDTSQFHGQRRERDNDGDDEGSYQDPQMSPSGKQKRRLSKY